MAGWPEYTIRIHKGEGRGTSANLVFEGRLRIEKASWICVMFYIRFFTVKSFISRHILARSGFLVLVVTSIRTLFIRRDHRRPASRFELGRSSHGPNISFNHPRSP